MENKVIRSAHSSTEDGHASIVLLIVCAAQFMLMIDDTIVNVGLPSIALQLQLSVASLSWVVNAYLLMFGGFLLLGGRMADLLGRRRVLIVATCLFVVTSAVCALSGDATTLIIGRGAEGLAGAFMSPAAFSTLLATFPGQPRRGRALATWASLTGLGAATGLLVGGTLVTLVGWRWIFWINVPIGLVTVLAARRHIPAPPLARHHAVRAPGAIGTALGTSTLLVLVYTLVETSDHAWTTTRTLVGFAIALALAVAFAMVERQTSSPLVPGSVLGRRNVALGNICVVFTASGLIAMFFFLTLFMQTVWHYSALRTGVSWLPFSLSLGVSSVVSARIAERVSPARPLLVGTLIGAAGLFWLSHLHVHGSYLTDLLPTLIVMGVGFGLAFTPLIAIATAGVAEHESGIASGLLATSQQLGSAIGLAVLVSIAGRITARRLAHGVGRPTALTDGFHTALLTQSTIMLVAAAVATALLVLTPRAQGS